MISGLSIDPFTDKFILAMTDGDKHSATCLLENFDEARTASDWRLYVGSSSSCGLWGGHEDGATIRFRYNLCPDARLGENSDRIFGAVGAKVFKRLC